MRASSCCFANYDGAPSAGAEAGREEKYPLPGLGDAAPDGPRLLHRDPLTAQLCQGARRPVECAAGRSPRAAAYDPRS